MATEPPLPVRAILLVTPQTKAQQDVFKEKERAPPTDSHLNAEQKLPATGLHHVPPVSLRLPIPAAIMVVDFPQEVVDEIIDRLADDEVTRVASLRGCSLISSQWPYRSQKHLFHKIRFTNINFLKWCERIRPGNDGPSLHVAILHYHTTLKESKRLVDGHRHLSSFTNLQKLHLREASLHGLTDEELSMCFKEMGCSVRSVSLRACKMTINDLASFVCQFTKLERLSIIDPIIPNAVFEDSVELPVFGGILELRYMLTDRGTRDFVHQLPLLPLAFHTVVLEAIHISLSAPISDLLATCRETLTRVDIRDRAFSYRSRKDD